MEYYSILLFVPESCQHFSFYGNALFGIRSFSSWEGHSRLLWEERGRGDWWGSYVRNGPWGQILPWATTRLWLGPKLERTWLSGLWSARWQSLSLGGWRWERGAGSCCHSSSHWLWTTGELPGARIAGALESKVVALNFLEHRACLCTCNSHLTKSFIILACSSACRWKGNFNPRWGLPLCCNNCSFLCITSIRLCQSKSSMSSLFCRCMSCLRGTLAGSVLGLAPKQQ